MTAPATKKNNTANASRSYAVSPEAWASFRASAKGAAKKDASDLPADVILAKPLGNQRALKALTSKDEAAAFLKSAPEAVREEALAAFPTKAAAGDDDGVGAVVPFVISDASADRDDDVVHIDGWDFAEHNRNPVMLWAHDHRTPGVGNGLGTHVDAAAADVKSIGYFTDRDVYGLGFMLGKMYARRVLRAVSVGFIAKLLAFNEERGDWAIDFLKQELIEFSPCNVGCNRNALSEARSIGIDTSPMIEHAVKVLDGEGGLWLPRAELEGIHRDLTGAKAISIGLDAFRKGGLAPGLREALKKKAEETPATPPPPALPAGVEAKASGELVDWKGVAVDLAKRVDAGDAARAVRAHTFDKTEGVAALGDRKGLNDAAALLELGPTETPATTPTTPPPAKTTTPPGGIDPSRSAGEDSPDDEGVSRDELKAITGILEERLADLATELTGRVA